MSTLDLDQARDLVERLAGLGVNCLLLAVTQQPPIPPEFHVQIAPYQHIDVLDLADAMREQGLKLHHDGGSPEQPPRGFIITPPPPPIDEAEEVVDGNPNQALVEDAGYGMRRIVGWRCGLCTQANALWADACGRCGNPCGDIEPVS